MYLFFDTETSGLPQQISKGKLYDPYESPDKWPHIVQLGWIVYDEKRQIILKKQKIVKPNNWIISENSEEIHGISLKKAMNEGVEWMKVWNEF